MEENSATSDNDRKKVHDEPSPETTSDTIFITPDDVVDEGIRVLAVFILRSLLVTTADAVAMEIMWFAFGTWYEKSYLNDLWYAICSCIGIVIFLVFETIIPYIRPAPQIRRVICIRILLATILLWITIVVLDAARVIDPMRHEPDPVLEALERTNSIISIIIVLITFGTLIPICGLMLSDPETAIPMKINNGTVIGIVSSIGISIGLCLPMKLIGSLTFYHAIRGAVPIFGIYHIFLMTFISNANVTWRSFKGYIIVTGLQLFFFFMALMPVPLFIHPLESGTCVGICKHDMMMSGLIYCTIAQIVPAFICWKISNRAKYVERPGTEKL